MPLRIPVTLRKGYLWQPDFRMEEIYLLLSYLLHHNYKQINKIISRALNIDTLSRVMEDNRINLDPENKSRRTSDRRDIDKALAMELLIALLLTYLDESDEVISNCVEQNELPNNFASSGLSDILVDYPSSDDGRAFQGVFEVSIMRRPTENFFLEQLEQTYKHAEEEVKTNGGMPVYGVTINRCNICANKSLQSSYRQFLADKQIERDSIIQVLPLYSIEFAGVMTTMLLDETYGFSSGVLARIFNTLIEQLRQEEPPSKPGWMTDTWFDIVNAVQAPELDLETPPDDGPEEPAEDKPDDDTKPK